MRRNRNTRVWDAISYLLVAAVLAGCTWTDRTVRLVDDRTEYNERIRQTENEQLLSNIVRLRYNDTPFFLDLGSVVVQYGVETSASGSADFGIDNFFDGSASGGGGGLSGEITWNEKPTVSYSPLQGEAYARRMLSSIPVEVMWLLANSGWSIERLMVMIVEQAEGLPNAPTASGPQPLLAPQFEGFHRLAGLLRSLQSAGALSLELSNEEGQVPNLIFRLDDSTPLAQADTGEVLDLLRLPDNIDTFRMSRFLQGDDVALVRTRSLMGVLYFIGNAIAVPDEHVQQGLVRVAQSADGSPFDWSQVTEDFLRIRSSASEPESAAVKVSYLDHWFYIDDRDPDSKATFTLLQLLFSLQSASGSGVSPLLTLPAG